MWSPAFTWPIIASVTAAMPGRGGACGLGALELGDALLEHRHGRIGEARILVAGVLALEASLRLRGIVVDVALGEEQRLRRLAELRAQDAGLDQAGFGAIFVLRGR